MVKNYIRKIFNKLKPVNPIKDKKKKDDINKEKEYVISLIELELDEKTFAILKKIKNSYALKIDNEKANKWLENGAKPTDTVNRLFKENGIYDEVEEDNSSEE